MAHTEEHRITLKQGEPHPVAKDALLWIKENCSFSDLMLWQASFSTCAIEGNREAEICGETLRRIMANEPVSDRYLLGLTCLLMMDKLK